MKQFIVALSVALLAAIAAHAQDEPLPDNVAQAYLAYETAITAQDYAAASEAAEAAWRAARAERIDTGLIGILAENYGQLAQRNGAYGEAYQAWRNAAEISGRLQAPAPEQALRWYNAGVAAFADGEVDEANRCLTRSIRKQADTAADRDEDLFGNTHYLIAATTAQRGRLSGVGEHARAAIAAFQASGRPFDGLYANAYYLSAIAHYSEGDHAESVLDFNMARGIFASLAEVDREHDLSVLGMWLSVVGHLVSEPERERVNAALAESAFPPPAPRGPSRIEDANNHDAAPHVRREPRYPREAARQRVEGVALVRFSLNAEGVPEHIEVIASIPDGSFGAASVEAVAQWRYEPAMLDGQPVPREGVETAFSFRMR